MGIKTYKPYTPGMRQYQSLDFSDITVDAPFKALTKGKSARAGRDWNGRISVRHKGGGHKRRYRIIDFRRDKTGVPGIIQTIEYDPNRSANIALVLYADGERRYIPAPKGLKVGAHIVSGSNAAIEAGNALPLENIPLGWNVHNVELTLGKGAQLARSAGTSALIAAKEGDYVTLKLPSGEMRMVFKKCIAVVGEVGNEDHMNIQYGKAGRKRWLGVRPSVRGMVMNPVDHPHGGGEGKNKGIHPVTPWGQPCKGYKTRSKHKNSEAFIVSRKKKK